MSRSDFWSVAATLFVCGIAYFVGGKYSAYGSIAVGGCIALYLLATHKKKQPKPATFVAKSIANPHQEVKQEANPRMDQNVHIYTHPTEKPMPPATPAKPEPTYNLWLQGCRMANLEENLDENGQTDGFLFTRGQSKPNAAVACIKNRSRDGEVADIEDVRAVLSFKDKDMHEIGHGVHRACWVENNLWNASFDVEQTHCVILALMKHDRVIVPFVKEQTTSSGPMASAEPYVVGQTPSYVELILVADGKRVMDPMLFEFYDKGDQAQIRLVTDDK